MIVDQKCRLYLKKSIFLDPSNPYGIKMFKYCNEETECMKQYKELFSEFAKKLEQDLQK